MGFFDWFRPSVKPKPRSRGPARSPSDRLKAEEARYIRNLSRTNPTLYEQVMRKRMGIDSDTRDEFEQLETSVNRLRRMGIIKSANELSGGGDSFMHDAVQGITAILGIQQQAAAAQQAAAQQAAMQQAPRSQPQLAPPQIPASETPELTPQNEEVQLTIIAQHVINELKDKSPAEGATWLAAQPYPQAQELVALFRQTSDDEIPVLLARLAQTSVDLAGIVAWLRQRPDWLMETVHAIRQIAA